MSNATQDGIKNWTTIRAMTDLRAQRYALEKYIASREDSKQRRRAQRLYESVKRKLGTQ